MVITVAFTERVSEVMESFDKTLFYSTFSNNIEEMLLAGKRVASFIEIEEREYPQGFVKRSTETPNCTCLIQNDSIDIVKLGNNIGILMKKQQQSILHIDIEDLEAIDLDIRKMRGEIYGYYLLFIDFKCKTIDKPIRLAISSLKPLLLIWNSPVFLSVTKRIAPNLTPLLECTNPNEIQQAIKQKGIEILPITSDRQTIN
jgi:hypothetical protein